LQIIDGIVTGVASVIAAAAVHPIDTIKVRIQITGNSPAKVVARLVRESFTTWQGFRELFYGVEPALWRGLSYGGLRYSLYSPIKQYTNAIFSDPSVTLLNKVISGSACGCLASAICSPMDLIKIRMQTRAGEGGMSMIAAASSIVKNEGWLGLYTGVGPTCARATVLAAAELSSYDHIKQFFLRNDHFVDGVGLHVATSFCAGFIAAIFSTPFDFVKSRLMNQQVDSLTGKGLLYDNMRDCFAKSFRRQGIMVLWSGFIPTFIRLGPNVIITFTCMEWLHKIL
jgi:hypothetical protein